MKTFIFLMVTILTSLSFASVDLYEVRLKSSIGEGKASKARFILKNGEPYSFSDEAENIIRITASEVGDEGRNIKMDINVSRELEDGSVVVLARPRIITSQNKKAEITIESEESERVSLELKIDRL